MPETKDVMSKRDQQLERLRKKYPDRQFEDEEEIYGAISDDYDQYEQELGKYRDQTQALSDMFAADPRSAQFLTDMHRGEDPILGLVRNFGLEIKDVLENPEMQEEIAKANKDYVERVAKNKELEEQYNQNLDVSLETLRQFQEERGLTESDIDAIMEKAISIVNEGVMGIFSPSTLEIVSKALNYDVDLAKAAEEGEIAGRNAKIVEKLRKRSEGDGTNPLGGSNNQAFTGKRTRNIFEIANDAK